MTALLFVLLLGSPTADLSAGVGVESNPFELPSQVPAPTPTLGAAAPLPGAFLLLEGRGEAHTAAGKPWRAGLRVFGDAHLYGWVMQDTVHRQPTHARDADEGSAFGGAPVTFHPTLPWDLTFGVEPFAGLHRETFTSPITGRAYASNGTSLARRFDTDRAGARATAEWESESGANAFTALSWQRVDYVDDFAGTVPPAGVLPIDRWDYSELRADGDLYLYPGGMVASIAYSFRDRFYDARYPHDSTGTPLALGGGVSPQVFVFHQVTLKAGVERDGLRALGKFDVERRLDLYAGYLNYTDATFSVPLRVVRGEWTAESEPYISYRRYDVARIGFDPAEPANTRWRIDASARVEHPLHPRAAGFVELGLTDQRSSSALYTFTAARLIAGVHATWR